MDNRENPGGVYAIICKKSGTRMLCSAMDLGKARERFEQCQQQGVSPEKTLQEEWNRYGPDAFSFEVVERVPKKQGQEKLAYQKEIDQLKEFLDMQVFGCC